MKRFSPVPNFVFYLLTALIVVISILAFVKSITWLDKPFPGFVAYHPPYAGSMGLKEWPGRQKGIKFGERILTVDNQPIAIGQDIIKIVRQKLPGTEVRYAIESKAGLREMDVPVTIFGFRDFLLTFLITFICGLSIFAIGFIAFLLKPNVATSRVFFFFCFFLSLYLLTSFEIMSTHSLVRFHYFASCFMGTTFLHLGLIFPERKRLVEKVPSLEYLIYIPAIILAIVYQVYFSTFREAFAAGSLTWATSYNTLGTLARIITFFPVIGTMIMVIHTVFRSASTSARQRAKIILFGVSTALLPATAIMMGSYLLKISFPWNFLNFFVIIFPAAIAYSIVRHNLFDADLIIRRTVGYAFVTAIIISVYALVTVSLNILMGQYALIQSRMFPIVFTLIVILVFNPLHHRVQRVVDRLFFRQEYDYGTIIDKIGAAMTSLIDLKQILNRLIKSFSEDLFIDSSSIMLRTDTGNIFRVRCAEGQPQRFSDQVQLNQDDPLIEVIDKDKRVITENDVLEDSRYQAISDDCMATFKELNARLIVPLVFQDKVIGIINLGDKKSGKGYRRADIDLLRTIAHQGAMAIENAHLFQENLEKQRMEEELAIARDLQMSMLPARCPQLKGLEIAALSLPAREVGGDFYDFIHMGGGKLGIVIGDVMGKGVSGALVMSAARSVFRMLSEGQLSMQEMFTLANRRAKKDNQPGMSIALLYAELDLIDNTLGFCSAGQTLPIHLTASSDQPQILDCKGDSFPLGLLSDLDYQETRIRLSPGDKIVLYTDGIVEAMNSERVMFGFERLLQAIEGQQNLSAENLLKLIVDDVSDFVGNSPQQDDLTVIVLSLED